MTTIFRRLGFVFLVTTLASCGGSTGTYELVLTNGFIYSMSWDASSADGIPADDAPYQDGIWYPDGEAIYIFGEQILYVGTNEGALSQAREGVEEIDLKGATVIPGLIDKSDLFDGLFEAITRTSPGDRLTPEQALRQYTVQPAITAGKLDSTGTISAGKRADLTIISIDPLNIDLSQAIGDTSKGADEFESTRGIGLRPTEILDGDVLMTIAAGRITAKQ